jgi:tRNA threonylcarbamoyladenosine biosynthesis protein TsaB
LDKCINILALDTATNTCSVALWSEGRVIAALSENMERGQAEALAPMISAVMIEARQIIPEEFSALHAIAVTIGPGAFTGVRIGLATAKALALPRQLPVIGLTTFEAIGCDVDQMHQPLLLAIETKREDFYVQMFDNAGAAAMEPVALTANEIRPLLPSEPFMVAGDGADRLISLLSAPGHDLSIVKVQATLDAKNFVALAAKRYQQGNVGRLSPLYLRAPSVTLRTPK